MGAMLRGLLHNPEGRRVTLRGGRMAASVSLGAVCVSFFAAGCNRPTEAPEPVAGSLREAVPQTEAALSASVENPSPSVPVTTVDGDRSPWKPRVAAREWAYVVIHHTATDAGSVESIHRTHSQRRDAAGNPWRGIGYHFVIGNGRGMEDGEIEPTFRWREQLAGAHAGIGAYNQRGIGVCLVGDFEKQPPTPAQLTSLKRLVAQLTAEYGIPPKQVVRHGDVKATNCPGKLFPMRELMPVAYSVSVH